LLVAAGARALHGARRTGHGPTMLRTPGTGIGGLEAGGGVGWGEMLSGLGVERKAGRVPAAPCVFPCEASAAR
jgi:hypothetical protein